MELADAMTLQPGPRPFLDDDDDDDDEEEDGKKGKEKEHFKDPAAFLGKGLLDKRIVLVAKPVDRELAAQITAQLLLLEDKDPEAPITVYVNSPGGDADSGFGIYDIMRFVRPPITTICLGLAASAAVTIFLGGSKGRRFSLPHSRFLIHQPSSYAQGQASDIEITANEIIKIRDAYIESIAEATGRSAKKILDDVNRDFWLTAKEAKEYGLVDRIVESAAELAKA